MFRRITLSLVVALFSFQALAGQTRKPSDCKFFTALSGGADHDSATLDMMPYKIGSFQVNWSGLGGTVNGSVKLRVNNDPVACSTCWLDVTGGAFSVTGASGTGMVYITGDALPGAYYQVQWLHGSAIGGTINGFCMAKE